MGDSASSSTFEHKNNNAVVCNCNQVANIVRAWTDANTGRRFYSCRGCKVGHRYESYNFFGWFDVEKPYGWQHEALIEARDVIRGQKEEIKKLRAAVNGMTHEGQMKFENPSDIVEELKQARGECEALKREVLILNERATVFHNVLITSSIGFTMVLGAGVDICKW